MRTMTWLAATAVTTLALTSCLGDGPTAPTCPVVQIPAVAGDTVTSESGLQYITIRNGTGAAATANSDVAIYYSGYLLDGTRFDQRVPPQQPLVYSLAGFVAGFREGVTGMREGGARRLIVPANLAYGATPQGCIPANSTLIFDVELVQTAARN
jgi:FKBP-type peptidyl-prolyl cis-trans isomerase